jgi:hypothetical protein
MWALGLGLGLCSAVPSLSPKWPVTAAGVIALFVQQYRLLP